MSDKHILVIDDDPAVRDGYLLSLEDAGAHLHIAAGGAEGLRLAAEQRPDLVFLDLRMPGLDGVETLRRLNELHADLTVYIVTAFAAEYFEKLHAARSEGLRFEVAAKPLGAEQIQQIARLNLA